MVIINFRIIIIKIIAKLNKQNTILLFGINKFKSIYVIIVMISADLFSVKELFFIILALDIPNNL